MPHGAARTAARGAPVQKTKAEVIAARKNCRASDARWIAMTELSHQRKADVDDEGGRDRIALCEDKGWIEAWCPVCPNPMKGECKSSPAVAFDLADQCAHGAPAFYAHRSLCCLLPENRLRKVAVWLATWRWFDRGVLALIALNTLLLTITDFSIVETDTLSPARVGTATAYPFESGATSAVNTFNFYADYFFTVAFTFEMLTKMVAMGVICEGRGTYLRDYWNWIDFVVVFAAWFQMVPGLPSVALPPLRVVRVLRPLRSLHSVPRLKALIEAILGAVPQLMNTLVLILMMFLVFGVLGLQLFVGVQHHRCRHTELPLRMPAALAVTYDADMSKYVLGKSSLAELPFLANVLANRTAFPYCAPTYALDGVAAAEPFALNSDEVKSWSTSPWNTARECVWPHVVEVDRVCSSVSESATIGQTVYRCPSSGAGVTGENATYCGSNYDDFGNNRFADWKAQRSVMWNEGANFGITHFDDILHGFVTIFQCITMEGWVDVMYMYADGAGWTIAPTIFMLMIVMGSFFLLNLTLAVLGSHFDSKMGEVEADRILRAAQIKLVNKMIKIYRRRMKRRQRADRAGYSIEEAQERGDADPVACLDKVAAGWNADLNNVWCQRCAAVEGKGAFAELVFSIQCAWPVKVVHAFVVHWAFQMFIICCILLNSITLSLDVYPPEPALESILEYVNFFLTVVFILEMGLKLYGLGLRVYLHDGFNVFDALIVSASILETAVAPPSFFGFPHTGVNGFGGLTALRTFRVFRLFKLARSWKALQRILATIARALQSGVYFLVLLMLFVLIYAFVGQQFFANRLHFDATTLDALNFKDIPQRYAGVADAWSNATEVEKAYAVAQVDATIYTPRSNFDTLSHSIFTIVQVLSGENWNVLLYDCWRAVDPITACAYLFSLVCIGSFVLLDFFLAILLNDFEKSAALAKEQEETEKTDQERNGMSQTIVSRFQRWLDVSLARTWAKVVVGVDAVSDKAECCFRRNDGAESGAEGGGDAAIGSVADAVLHASPTVRKKRTPEEQLMKANIMVQNMVRMKRAKARLEDLRRRALFRGENVHRKYEDPVPIRIEGGRVCFCFGRRARVCVAALIERSAADFRCVRLREGDTVVTDLEHCGGILDTTHARILRVHNNDDVAIGTRFDIETLTWSYQLGNSLLSRYGESELTFKELRQLLPQDITDEEFNRLCTLADEDDSKTIDGRELGILLESVRGIELRGLSQSQIKWQFSPFQSLLRTITFDNVILILIIISSVMLAVESPLWDPNSARPTVMKWLDFGINILFTIEIVLKVIAYGVIRRKSSYLRNWWNVGDFAIVIISWSTFVLSEVKELKALRSVRLLRVLRTLRSINKLPGLKRVVEGLMLSVGPLMSVLPVILLIFLIFAIVLTSSLKGALSHCSGDAYDALTAFQQALIYNPVVYADLSAEQKRWGAGEYNTSPGFSAITSKPICLWMGGEWERKVAQSFDNTLLSFSALTQLSTTEGWTDVAFAAVDSRGMEMQPKAVGGAAEEVWLFVFIVFEAVGAFFLVNLFIGILIVTFAAAKAARERGGEGGSSFLMTRAQQEYMKKRTSLEEELKPMHAIRMLEPRLPLQKFFYDVVENWGVTIELPLKCLCVLRCAKNCPKSCVRRCCGNFYRVLQCVDCKSWCGRTKVALNFDTIIFGCIIANTVVMAITYFGEPEYYSMTLNIFNWAFALIFTVEAALKLIAFGACGYFMQPWNTFDFVIVLGTAIGLTLSVGKEFGVLALDIDIGPAATVIRSFRIARMIRLVRFARQLRVIVDTLLAALPAMINVSLLVALVFFIYTVIGVQVFAKVGFRGEALNEHANFMNFQNGFLTLFRCATGEAWPDLMYDMAHGPEGCEVDPKFDPNKCGFASPMFREGCADINGCGDPYGARAFHFSFQIVCGFVMLNLIIFYVLDSFNNMNMSAHGLDMDDHKLLLEAWLRFDQNCIGHIDLERLIDMLRTLPAPMGFGQEEPKEGSNLYLAENSKQFVKILEAEQAAVPLMDAHGFVLSSAFCACGCCCGMDDRSSEVVRSKSAGGGGRSTSPVGGLVISRASSANMLATVGLAALRKDVASPMQGGSNVKISRRQVLKQIVQVLRIPAVPSLQFSRGVYLLSDVAVAVAKRAEQSWAREDAEEEFSDSDDSDDCEFVAPAPLVLFQEKMPLPPQNSSLEGRRLRGISLTPQIINPDAYAWSEQPAALSEEQSTLAPKGLVLPTKRGSPEGGAAAIEMIGMRNANQMEGSGAILKRGAEDGGCEGQAGVRAALPPRLPQGSPSRRGASFSAISSAGTAVTHMPTPLRPTAVPAVPAVRGAEHHSAQPQGGDGSSDGEAVPVGSTWSTPAAALPPDEASKRGSAFVPPAADRVSAVTPDVERAAEEGHALYASLFA